MSIAEGLSIGSGMVEGVNLDKHDNPTSRTFVLANSCSTLPLLLILRHSVSFTTACERRVAFLAQSTHAVPRPLPTDCSAKLHIMRKWSFFEDSTEETTLRLERHYPNAMDKGGSPR